MVAVEAEEAAEVALDAKADPEAAAKRRFVSGSLVVDAREAIVEAVVKSLAAEPPAVETPGGLAEMGVDPGPHTTPTAPHESTATARSEGVVGVLRVGR